jgi:hypothetical protein
MQVMQAEVGCQKRWMNSLARRFQSVEIMSSPSRFSMIARKTA